MKIWWCQEHEAEQDWLGQRVYPAKCWKRTKQTLPGCRMVAMRLIPDNAETVDRLDALLEDWEFHDVRLRVNDETAWLRMSRSDFIRAVFKALDGETP